MTKGAHFKPKRSPRLGGALILGYFDFHSNALIFRAITVPLRTTFDRPVAARYR